jgi:anaerobic glycerol-3-phosphate dehydrogenase
MMDELNQLFKDDPYNDIEYQRYLDEMEMQDLLSMEENPDLGNEVEAEHRRLRALPTYNPNQKEVETNEACNKDIG